MYIYACMNRRMHLLHEEEIAAFVCVCVCVLCLFDIWGVQTLSHYGYFSLPSAEKVGGALQSSFDVVVGASNVQDPQAIAFTIKQILQESKIPTAGFCLGFAWGILRS